MCVAPHEKYNSSLSSTKHKVDVVLNDELDEGNVLLSSYQVQASFLYVLSVTGKVFYGRYCGRNTFIAPTLVLGVMNDNFSWINFPRCCNY